MTLEDRFTHMMFKVRIVERMRYMIDAGVEPEFVKSFGDYIDYMLSHNVDPEYILKEKLPVFPPYRRLVFDNKEDCDRFCGVIKSWYGLDYRSKKVADRRWRLIPC